MSSSEPEHTTSSGRSEALNVPNCNMKTSWMSLALAGIAAVADTVMAASPDRRGLADLLGGLANKVVSPEALAAGADAAVNTLIEPAVKKILPSVLPDPWDIGEFTYEQELKGIPLCSKLVLNADGGTLTGLDKLQLVDIKVLKVDASYDKLSEVGATMEVKLAAPPGAVIELKGLSGSVQASCKPFPLKGAIGADTSLDGLRVNATATTVLDLSSPTQPKLKCLKVDSLDFATSKTTVDLTSVATPLKLVESKIEELLAKAMDKILAPIIEKAIPAATKVVSC